MRQLKVLKAGLYALLFLLSAYLIWGQFIWVVGFVFTFSLFSLLNELKKLKIILATIVSFFLMLTFNSIATGWLLNTSYSSKAILVFVANSVVMTLPFFLWYVGRRYANFKYFHFILIWLVFEYIHFHWALSWPWLTFGHIFGHYPQVVQWYEFTGVLGGTLWLLVVGYLIYLYINHSFKNKHLFFLAISIVVPLFFTYMLTNNNEVKGNNQLGVSLVQIGFAKGDTTFYSNFKRIKYLTTKFRNEVPKGIDYILLPELTLNDSIWLSGIKTSFEVKLIQNYLKKYHPPKTSVILGLELYDGKRYKGYHEQQKKYNAIVEINYEGLKSIYVKNKYIPFQERTPYGFGFLNIYSEEYSKANTPTQQFYNKQLNFNPILAICYESIYGYYLNSQVKPTPSAIFMFSNEAFLNNSVGVEQYFNISKLRAIELRKDIARSSNMGYSAIIDSKGAIRRLSNKKNFEIINGVINKNDSLTFYAKHGDYIGVISFIILLLLIIKSIRFSFFLIKLQS